MPAGDWGSGSKILPGVINITLKEGAIVAYVGVGYSVITPSGLSFPQGFAWDLDDDSNVALSALMQKLIYALAAKEGGLPVIFNLNSPSEDYSPIPPTVSVELSAGGLDLTAIANVTLGTGTITTYSFDFGDSENSGDLDVDNTTHTYAAAGTYTVTCTVTTSDRQTASGSSDITVTAP